MRVRVVGVDFLFPGRERVNSTSVVVTTLMPTHTCKIQDCLSACIFPSEGCSAKSSL